VESHGVWVRCELDAVGLERREVDAMHVGVVRCLAWWGGVVNGC